MHVMKQPKQGLELQISNGVKMERRVEEGRRTGEPEERRGRWQVVKSERFFTVLPRGGVKGSYRVRPVRPVTPEVPEKVAFQTIRVNIRSIRV